MKGEVNLLHKRGKIGKQLHVKKKKIFLLQYEL